MNNQIEIYNMEDKQNRADEQMEFMKRVEHRRVSKERKNKSLVEKNEILEIIHIRNKSGIEAELHNSKKNNDYIYSGNNVDIELSEKSTQNCGYNVATVYDNHKDKNEFIFIGDNMNMNMDTF